MILPHVNRLMHPAAFMKHGIKKLDCITGFCQREHHSSEKVRSYFSRSNSNFSYIDYCAPLRMRTGDFLCKTTLRSYSSQPQNRSTNLSHKNKTVLIYLTSMVVLVVGMSFAAVPLYRLYCQATGKGGIAVAEDNAEKIKKMKRIADRVITIHFSADTASSLQWNFKPQQISIKVVPGETALAFYTAKNPTNRPVDGVATYNVIPYEASQYFNKIQCFCFEEQRLNPNEEVDMPVFFFIDPDFMEDPRMETVDDITLSYTFFEAKEGMALPFPVVKK